MLSEIFVNFREILLTHKHNFYGLVESGLEAFLSGEVDYLELPRQFIRNLPVLPSDFALLQGYTHYTLLGLSGVLLLRIAYMIAGQGRLQEELERLDGEYELIFLDRQIDENGFVNLDTHDVGISRKGFRQRSLKVNKGFYLISLLCFVVGIVYSPILLVCLAILLYINFSKDGGIDNSYLVHEGFYRDLQAWSHGKERNASLYHAMRSKLYRNFSHTYRWTKNSSVVFRNTLDRAYYKTKQPQI
jgi:hypothetical protein